MSLVDFIITCASKIYWREQVGSGSRIWSSIASSSDGSKLVACVDNNLSGYIYTSTNYGVTWTQRAGPKTWQSVVSSSDGTKLAAITSLGDYIYTSTDSGVTWVAQTGSGIRNWLSIACSSDGVKLAAGYTGSHLYTSTDSGVTWTLSTGLSNPVQCVTSSSDGTKLAVFDTTGSIWTSADSGASWTLRTRPVIGTDLRLLTYSPDGTKLAVVQMGWVSSIYGILLQSSDSGVTWSLSYSFPYNIASISYSSNGSVIGVATDSATYISKDSGSTYTEQVLPTTDFSSIAVTPDGTKYAVTATDGYIYTYN